jgi:hypothetical protein
MKANYKITLTKTIVIDLDTEDKKIIYVIFNTMESDEDSSMIAEVYTAYKDGGNLAYQFGLPCNDGNENYICETVVSNYETDNIFWD